MARTPSEDQAAAIAAAVELFRTETAPAPVGEETRIRPWQRAALIEGVGAKGDVEENEGGERWLW